MFELRANNAEAKMERLIRFDDGIVLSVLSSQPISDDAKIEALNFLGLAFNVKEEVMTLFAMKTELENFNGSEKAKKRLEERIDSQQQRVNEASEQASQAYTNGVEDTLNKPYIRLGRGQR